MQSLSITLAGAQLVLLPERAAYLPDTGTLLVADAHFGKGASFRALGVPVPGGTTQDNLARLDRILARHAVRHLVFLGDLLHSRHAQGAGTLGAVSAWRAAHAGLACTLIRGNHDLRAGDPPDDWAMTIVSGPLRLGPFQLCHAPEDAGPEADGYVLAGHVHPAVSLAGRIDAVRLPCFLFSPRGGLLPAFGAFTGSHTVRPEAGDRVYGIVEDRVLALLR